MDRSAFAKLFALLLATALIGQIGCRRPVTAVPLPAAGDQADATVEGTDEAAEDPGTETADAAEVDAASASTADATTEAAAPDDPAPTDDPSDATDSLATDSAEDPDNPPDVPAGTGASGTEDLGGVGQVSASDSPTPPAERFALLTPGGPLIIDLFITLDGDVHSTALETLVDEALAAADTDGDGEATWDEVANSPKFQYGQFGNLPITEEAQKQQLITMYDRNENGLVDRNELPRFVTRNVGRARSFSLRSSNEFRSDNRSRSPFRRLLDTDRDGAITPEEMAAAPARILSRDADDDQIITLADFKDDPQVMPGQMSNRRRTTEPDTAFVINDTTKWSYATFALQELYSYGDAVGAGDWPLTPELFATLDTDGDERLDRQEVEQLLTVEPHFRLRARFGVKEQEDGPRTTSLELDFVDPKIEALVTAVRTHQRRVSIELSRVEIEFFVNEDPALSNYEQVAKGQFDTLDTDQNGYLEEDEIPAQLPGFDVPFAGVDADADGKVFLEELASFLELRQRAYRGQVRSRAADQEDALFTALDTSGDGRLHAREIAATPSVLARLDLNQDGNLQSHEIPGSMVVGFVRGNPQQDNGLFVMPTGESELDPAKLPRWFLGMDTNRDGEVGVLEFLGTADRFAAFDQNGDGFINPSELPEEMLVAPAAAPVADEAADETADEAADD